VHDCCAPDQFKLHTVSTCQQYSTLTETQPARHFGAGFCYYRPQTRTKKCTKKSTPALRCMHLSPIQVCIVTFLQFKHLNILNFQMNPAATSRSIRYMQAVRKV